MREAILWVRDGHTGRRSNSRCPDPTELRDLGEPRFEVVAFAVGTRRCDHCGNHVTGVPRHRCGNRSRWLGHKRVFAPNAHWYMDP
jgi:hypothetical protein